MSNIDIAVGSRMARARRRRGWFQHDLAERAGRSESWVSQVERGLLPLDSLAVAEKIAALLEVTVAHLLAFDVRYPSAAAPVEQPPPVPAGREAEQAGAWLAAASPDSLAILAARASGATAPTPDPSLLADLKTIGLVYRRCYRIVPSGALLDLALSQLQLALSFSPATQPEQVRRQLLRHAGEMAALAAGLHMTDAGHLDKAEAMMNLAASLAKATGDTDLAAVIYGGRACLAAETGPLAEALDWALAARDAAAAMASPRTRAWVAAVASDLHAVLGEESEASRALEQARTALQDPGDDEVWAGLGWLDTAKLDAYEGGNLLRLRRYAPAIDRLTAALDDLEPAMSGHRATALAERAHALALSGDAGQACADAELALGFVERVHYRKTFHQIMSVARLLPARSRASGALRAHILEIRSSRRLSEKGAAAR